jgi:hypothetical protein
MKRITVTAVLATIGGIVFASMALSATAATGTVNGSVKTSAGSPVVGAKVVLESRSDSSYGATTQTDKEGAFTFTGAPVGGLNVSAYNDKEELLVTGKGELQFAGEVITLPLEVP